MKAASSLSAASHPGIRVEPATTVTVRPRLPSTVTTRAAWYRHPAGER